MTWTNVLFSFDGRIGRKMLWIYSIIWFLLIVVFAVLAGVGLMAYVHAADPSLTVPEVVERTKELAPWVKLALGIVLMYPWVALGAKRFHDRGKPTWLALVGAAAYILLALLDPELTGMKFEDSPVFTGSYVGIGMLNIVLGIWYLIELGFLRGTVGPNRYGPDPRDTASAAVLAPEGRSRGDKALVGNPTLIG